MLPAYIFFYTTSFLNREAVNMMGNAFMCSVQIKIDDIKTDAVSDEDVIETCNRSNLIKIVRSCFLEMTSRSKIYRQ